MGSQFEEIYGSVLQAAGTIEAAVGSTPFPNLTEEQSFNLLLQGNVLQAAGNGLKAGAQGDPLSLEALGDEIQALGNTVVVAGLLLDFEDGITDRLFITGNWLQAQGSLVGIADEFDEGSTLSGRSYVIAGGILEAIGNSLQALGGTYLLRNIKSKWNSELLDIIGSWIQAAGSILSLIGQIMEETEEVQAGINE